MIVGVEFASNTVIAGLDPAVQAGRGEMLEHLQPSWPDLIHGCPVKENRLSATIHTQPKTPLAGLDPAIYVFLAFSDPGGQDVDARNKSGQGVLTAASWLPPLDPTLSQLLNRTVVGQARA